MRARAILFAILLLPAPALAQGGADTQASDSGDWAPWLNETLNVRVPIEPSLGNHYPEEWEGPQLVVHELDVTEALLDAGWPLDPSTGSPQSFTVDLDSIRVAPRGEDPEATPVITWDGAVLSSTGTHPSGHRIVTVAFLADPEVDTYHIYFDRRQDEDSHDPTPRDPIAEQRIMQLLAGPGSGHELYGIVQGGIQMTIASAYATEVRVEELTSQGWNTLGCGGEISASPSSWKDCSYGGSTDQVSILRVRADKPVAAYGWANAPRFMPLVSSTGGYAGETLLVPDPGAGGNVFVEALEGSCEVRYGAGNTRQASTTATSISPVAAQTRIEADCPIIGWMTGLGPSPIPTHPGTNLTRAAMAVQGSAPRNDIVVVGDEGARVLFIHDDSSEETVKRLLQRTAPRLSGHDDLAVGLLNKPKSGGWRAFTEGNLAWGNVWDPSAAAMPMASTPHGSIGWVGPVTNDRPQVRVASFPLGGSPEIGTAIEGRSVPLDEGISTRPAVSRAVTYGSGDGQIDPTVGGLVEAGPIGSPRLLASYALIGSDDAVKAPGTFVSHLRPLDVEEGDAQIVGPLFNLHLDPESRVAAPGDVLTFELEGQGSSRDVTGAISEITLALEIDAETEAPNVPPLDVSISDSRVDLPVDASQRVTTVTATVPSNIPPDSTPSYRLTVQGTPVDGGDPIQTVSTVQVIPHREISLTFSDGSKVKDLETDPDAPEAELTLTNKGTATEDIELSTILPEEVAWDVRLLDADRNQPLEDDVIDDLAPAGERRLLLDIDAPGDTARVVSINIVAQSVDDASVASEATARVAHGVSVDVASSVRPDLITLHPGTRGQVNLSLVNHGSPVNTRIHPDPPDGLIIEANRTSVNLGENGSAAATTDIPLDVVVENDAPIGGVLVSTIKLDISVGELEPIESLMSLRVRVVPQHALEPTGTLELLPGLEQETNLTVRATGDADESVELSLLRVPAGWTVQAPPGLEVPRNTTAPVPLTVTPPPQTPAGTYDLALLATPDDGTEPIPIRFSAAVSESPAFEMTTGTGVTIGLGATRTLQVAIENRGNAAGETTIEPESPIVGARLSPNTVALGPGDQENVTLEITAEEVGNGTLDLVAEPGGEASIPVRVGRVELGLDLVSTSPATPEPGSTYRAVLSVTNDGTVAARDVEVALVSGEQRLQSETIGRLPAGQAATITVATDELPSVQDLRAVVDPDGRYTQETVTDDSVLLSSDDVPMPGWTILLALIAMAAIALRRP